MEDVERYRAQSRWTDPGRWAARLREIPPEPGAVVRAVSGLLQHPMMAPVRGIEVPEAAREDQGLRAVDAILVRVLARDDRSLTIAREPARAVFCVCAGFARLATAVFRAHAVPARCRVGFATYFSPGHLVDHWVCEHWDGTAWHLLDAELDEATVRESGVDFAATDVPRDRFLDASSAWCRMRAGELDASSMGLSMLGLIGAWFVAGNVMLDVAALNREEMLPWEKWSVARTLGPGSDVPDAVAAQLDQVARRLRGAPDGTLAERVYREHEWLRVTPRVLSFLGGAPVEIALA
jgi:hypothetical protein